MSKSEILALCHEHAGDINKASRAYAKKHGLPARDVLAGWKVIISTSTRAKGAKESNHV